MNTTDNPDELDTASSASRQHYIDTGRYLTRAEVAEWADDDETEDEGPSARAFADALYEYLTEVAGDDDFPIAEMLADASFETYRDGGWLTRDAGFVIRFGQRRIHVTVKEG